MNSCFSKIFFYVDEFLRSNFTYFGCIGSLLVRGLFSSCREWGLLSHCGAQHSHRGDSCVEHGVPGGVGFGSCGSRALEPGTQ